jgi:two-component system, OmpR family, alkaline phosphatase synthesis response regulator PhoP
MHKILLVDDLGIDVMLTRVALEGHGTGCRIATAADGDEAFRMLARERFDLLLLDIKMPRVDGFELLARLRAENVAHPPVIVVSGSGLQSDRVRAAALGAVDYVQKAVDYGSFKEELREALARHGVG